LDQTERVELPNAAPAFLIRVSRSLFVERKTMLTFKDGVLTDVSIDKPSSVAAFVNLPLQAVQVLVQIPVKALTIRTNEYANRKALIQVQAQLIQTLIDYQKQQEAATEPATKMPKAGKEPSPAEAAASSASSEAAFDSCKQNAALTHEVSPAEAAVLCKGL
jgi:alpha-beta hydrolase superfamily lysophospholipase